VAAEFYSGDDEAAVRSAERMIRFRPDKPFPYRFRAAALGHLGRIDDAKVALQEAMAFSKDFQVYVRTRPAWQRREDHARFVEGLRKAGFVE
jgi:Flp pilus assembly protein TadD